jgi:formate hydrogenlyase subunit 6/NADH:ubiquinone oxidoreductase subunit I
VKYPKVRELGEAIKSLVKPAYTTGYPAKPHTPAKNYRGKPVLDDGHCVGCETCANVCPSGVITLTDDKEKKIRITTRDYGLCIFCGQCQEHCITGKGVRLSDQIYEMSVFDRSQLIERQQKELLICESCGAVITTKDHLNSCTGNWDPEPFHPYLTSMSSMRPSGVLNETLRLASVEDIHVEIKDDLKRKDLFNVICPNCLRKVQVNTSW